MILGIDTLVIDLEDAKKIVETVYSGSTRNRKFYEKLADKGLLETFDKFKDKVKELEDLKNKICSIEEDYD